jgi:tetrahydromethanopterin S-methyltransferase subunit E
MNLLLKYGGPKANFAFGLLFVFASIAGVAGLIQHFTWRGAIAVVMLIVFAASCLAVSREGMRRD